MAAGDFRIGLDGEFLWGAKGSSAATESSDVEDVQLELSAIAITALLRGDTWENNDVVALQATVSFNLYDREGGALVAALRAAFLAKDKIALWPKDITGGEGLDADYVITKFSRSEQTQEYIKYAVECKPNRAQRTPQWH